MPGPGLSIIVVSYNSPATLELCLESLASQLHLGKDEVIVADCSDRDPRLGFRQQFPYFRFLRFDERLSIPKLRREGLKVARAEIVAFTEGRLVPASGWAKALLEAHAIHKDGPAVGGPIDFAASSPFDAAVFFCEYGWHMPPTGDGEAEELSGANLSYKRWALELCRDLIDAAAWEPFWHQRLKQHGHRLVRAGRALVCYHNSLSPSQFLRQRFHYGRWFAAARAEGSGFLRRLLYAAICPLLPVLLTVRQARLVLKRRRHQRAFFAALPWIVPFYMVWSLGEFCGYLTGKGSSDRRAF
ncbi:MAG: glycosyltransferase family 2 protein [Acidobacteria bacterium]|nr:glycosyltransferase family 2 protein [Acidobacteriota bacterium]